MIYKIESGKETEYYLQVANGSLVFLGISHKRFDA